MNVILRKNMKALGVIGEIVSVKLGYARNYLLPKGIAVEATPGNMKMVEEEKGALARKSDREMKKAQSRMKGVRGVSVTATVKVSEEEQMYGSVTTVEIQKLLSEQGIEVEKRELILDEPIKSLGVYSISLRFHPEVEGTIKLWVIKE